MLKACEDTQELTSAWGWTRDGDHYSLETSAAVIAELRAAWADGDRLVLPLCGPLALDLRPTGALVTDVESGLLLARIRTGAPPLVTFASGRAVRWLVPTWLVWQCGFVGVGGPGLVPGSNVVLFSTDGTGIVPSGHSPTIRPAHSRPGLTEAELLLALGWLFLLVGMGGRRTVMVEEALHGCADGTQRGYVLGRPPAPRPPARRRVG